MTSKRREYEFLAKRSCVRVSDGEGSVCHRPLRSLVMWFRPGSVGALEFETDVDLPLRPP